LKFSRYIRISTKDIYWSKDEIFAAEINHIYKCRPEKSVILYFILKNLNIDLPFDPAIPRLGIYPKEWDTGYSRGTCTPMFIAALFTIAKLWKQPRCPTTD
jgi:hypothetical protein